MNCQEYKGMIEDALDVSLHGELKTNVLRHLEHCPECREYYAWRRQEHSDLFLSVNTAYSCPRPPPADFTERVLREVAAQRSTKNVWRRLSMPRWALIAASLVISAGFVFAAMVASGAFDDVETETAESEGAVETTETTETAEATKSYALIDAISSSRVLEVPDKHETTVASSVSNIQGESTMTGKKAATVAPAAAMVVTLPTATKGDGYRYIISGWPAESESRSLASATGTLEVRSYTRGASVGRWLYSTKYSAMIILFK